MPQAKSYRFQHGGLDPLGRDTVQLGAKVLDLAQTVGGMLGYLRVHRGQRFASTTAVAPMTEAFVHNIEQFIVSEGVDLVTFEKGQRKDDVTQKYVRKFKKNEML